MFKTLAASMLLWAALQSVGHTQAVKADECLGCHEKQKGVMHGAVSCTDCHTGIAEVPHAEKLPKPACEACHEDAVRKYAGDTHASRGLACSRCHNAHNVTKEKKYCTTCHGNVLHKTLPARDKHLGSLSCLMCHGKIEGSHIVTELIPQDSAALKRTDIDRDRNRFLDQSEWHALEALLQKEYKGKFKISIAYDGKVDAHGVLGKAAVCNDCHEKRTRFGSATLKVKGRETYELKADPAIFIPEIPSVERYTQTVHGKKGVGCADCHRPATKMADVCVNCAVCINCHREEQKVYEESVHAKKGAHHCTECHNPHKVKAYKELNVKERVAVCSRCHKDYIEKHRWLPNTALHFDYLECATCHSPQSEKSMVFFFAKREGRRKVPLQHEEFDRLFGSGAEALRRAGRDADGRAAATPDLTTLFVDGRKLEKDLIIDASILVTKVHHDYSQKRPEERQCMTCHSRDAGFYGSMFLILPGKDGKQYLPVKGTLLSAYPIGMFIDLCLLGEGKIRTSDVSTFWKTLNQAGAESAFMEIGFKWVDFIGITLFWLVLLFIGIHVVLRGVSRL